MTIKTTSIELSGKLTLETLPPTDRTVICRKELKLDT
jgi:hypothetical protein